LKKSILTLEYGSLLKCDVGTLLLLLLIYNKLS